MHKISIYTRHIVGVKSYTSGPLSPPPHPQPQQLPPSISPRHNNPVLARDPVENRIFDATLSPALVYPLGEARKKPRSAARTFKNPRFDRVKTRHAIGDPRDFEIHTGNAAGKLRSGSTLNAPPPPHQWPLP